MKKNKPHCKTLPKAVKSYGFSPVLTSVDFVKFKDDAMLKLWQAFLLQSSPFQNNDVNLSHLRFLNNNIGGVSFPGAVFSSFSYVDNVPSHLVLFFVPPQ